MQCNAHHKKIFKYFWAIFFIGVAGFFPTLLYAACDPTTNICTDTSNGSFFTPASSDQSIIYLGELFGSIPPVLAGTGSGLMGQLFKVFNTAVMTLGIIIAGYTTFVGILNTAGEGEMLGKAWSSIWLPIRTVAGIALLIPTASGYCVCQIFMMWLLVQGVGAADTLTSTVVDYMESGQKIFVQGDVPDSSGKSTPSTSWDSTVNTVYQGLVCMQSYQKQFPAVNGSYMAPPDPTTNSSGNIVYNFSAVEQTGTNSDGTPKTEIISCGTIEIPATGTTNSLTAPFLQQGLAAIMPSLNSAAYFMVNDVVTTGSVNDSSINNTNVAEDTFNFVGSDFLVAVENTYNSFVTQASNAASSGGSSHDGNHDYYEDIRNYGWVTLGDLYWDMAKSAGSTYSGNDESFKLKWSGTTNIGKVYSSPGDCQQDYSATACTYANTWAPQFVTDLKSTRDNADTNGGAFDKQEMDAGAMASSAMADITLDVLASMEKAFSGTDNPMISAQKLGHDITLSIEISLAVLMTAMTGIAIAAGVSSSISPAYLVYQTVMAFALPGLMVFCGLLLMLGGTLAVVIPFIPALAYFMAVLAWLIGTLETIVAAPIVAIGLIHPDGQHQVWGKAEPAVMLIINMFLRPSLIVIGMAAGIILSFITVQFVNFGFQQAMMKVIGSTKPSGVETTLYLTTYVALILACVNKSFSAVDMLPETVMRWIAGGEGTKFGGGQDAMQKLQGTQESGGQKAAGDTTSSGQESAGAGEKAGAAMDKQAERKGAADQAKKDGKVSTGFGGSRSETAAETNKRAANSGINDID